MYTPKYFRNNDKDEVLDFIRKNNFGILVSNFDDRPWATHIPFILNEAGTKLTAHLARGNKQWKQLNPDKEVLIIFQGPHAYISSSWYDHENVPTWNYMAAHVYAKPTIIEGEELKQALRELVDYHEQGQVSPVSVDTMTPSYLAKEMLGIVGLNFKITDIQATYKLSQNRDRKNHQRVTENLEKQGYPDSIAIAQEMKKRMPE